jgi:hypothetical protein
MRRLARGMLLALTALSSLALAATCVEWVRSYHVADGWIWSDGADRPRHVYRMGHRYEVFFDRGGLYVVHDTGWWYARQSQLVHLPPDAALPPFVSLRSWAGFAWADYVGAPLPANVRVPPFRLYRIGGVPLWAIAVACGVMSAVYWGGVRRCGRRRAEGFCRGCSYDLTGNVSGVCPECGTKIATAGEIQR